MTTLRTIDDIMDVLPEEVELDKALLDNLAQLGLAIDGFVTITGFANGELTSTNTQKGRDHTVKQLVARMKE